MLPLAGNPSLLRGGDGKFSIPHTQVAGIHRWLEFFGQSTVEEHQKTKAIFYQSIALPGPRIRFCAGRHIEPIAGEGESFSQVRQCRITGIIVGVEAEIQGCGIFVDLRVTLVSDRARNVAAKTRLQERTTSMLMLPGVHQDSPLDGQKILKELETGVGQDGLGMELHTFDAQFAVT